MIGVGDAYRFGFNGKEKDDEVKGNGNHYTTLFRQYDPRTARWFAVDPKANDRASLSPYVSMDNNPVLLNDPKGDCPPGVDCGERLKRPAGTILYQSRNRSNPFAFNEGGRMSLPTEKSGTYRQEYISYTTNHVTNVLSPGKPKRSSVTQVVKSVTWEYSEDGSQITLKTVTTTTTSPLEGVKQRTSSATETSHYMYEVVDSKQLRLIGDDYTFKARRDDYGGTTRIENSSTGSDEFNALKMNLQRYNRDIDEGLQGSIEGEMLQDHYNSIERSAQQDAGIDNDPRIRE